MVTSIDCKERKQIHVDKYTMLKESVIKVELKED